MTGGSIPDNGGGLITGKGVCWSTKPSPTLHSPHSSDGTGANHGRNFYFNRVQLADQTGMINIRIIQP